MPVESPREITGAQSESAGDHPQNCEHPKLGIEVAFLEHVRLENSSRVRVVMDGVKVLVQSEEIRKCRDAADDPDNSNEEIGALNQPAFAFAVDAIDLQTAELISPPRAEQ